MSIVFFTLKNTFINKFKIGLYGAGILVLFISCETEKKIEGHWVSVGYGDGTQHRTVDIIDSTFWQNKNSLVKMFSIKGTLRPIGNDQYDIYHESGFISSLMIRNDTLKLFPGSVVIGDFNFVRKEPNFEADLFSELEVQVELPVHARSNCEHSLGEGNFVFVSVGKEKRKENRFAIQFRDVFINSADMAKVLDQRMAINELLGLDKFSVVLSIDKNTPADSITDVVRSIRDYDDSVKFFIQPLRIKKTRFAL